MSIKRTNKTYRDITNINLQSNSRLNAYNPLNVTETNQFFLNVFKYFEIPRYIKDNDAYFTKHVCGDSEWWDNISYEYYKTSYFWYVLCEFNDVVNPYESLYEGKMVKVIDTSYLYYIFRDFKDIRDL